MKVFIGIIRLYAGNSAAIKALNSNTNKSKFYNDCRQSLFVITRMTAHFENYIAFEIVSELENDRIELNRRSLCGRKTFVFEGLLLVLKHFSTLYVNVQARNTKDMNHYVLENRDLKDEA